MSVSQITAVSLGRIALQARISFFRVGVMRAVIALLLALGVAIWLWFALHALDQGQQEHALALTGALALKEAQQALRVAPVEDASTPEFTAEQNLQKFYDALGERAEVELYLKDLFAIAAQMEISLDQGEYLWQNDKNSGTYRYQILLPVKGAYRDIRRFCEKTLRDLPFVSLDELSFKRESVGDDEIDVNLRFTFFLKDAQHMPQPAGVLNQ